MTALITTDLVALDADLGADKGAVVRRLAELIATAGRATGAAALHGDAMAREAQAPTGLPGGIAIPHCRSAAVTQASLGFARLSPKVDFGAPDGPADLVFLIAAPAHGDADHLTLLTALARALVRPEFVASLRAAASDEEIVRLVDEVVSPAPEPAPAQAAATAPAPTAAARRSVVVVSACPTGIAHTYMAADKLVAAGKTAGVDIHVETQGSSGATPLDPAVIRAADAVIFAVDVGVRDQDRFAGKPLVQSGTKRAINEPDVMIREALAAADDPDGRRVAGTAGGTGDAVSRSTGGGARTATEVRRWLLTGVSYMIPFVAAGGLLIALGFLFGGTEMADIPEGETQKLGNIIALTNSLTELPSGGLLQYLGAVMFALGSLAFQFLIPALAGYIAFAIADRPGIAPGFTAGAVAGFVGAGFIGGIVGGLIAGFSALWISGIKVPKWFRGLMPVVIIPLFASLAVGLVMFLLLGRPLAWVNTSLTNWLNGMTGTSAVLLGVILGLMMCFDLGGPVNKAAYAFATTGLAAATVASYEIMATVMAAGMVPPLAMALATVVRPKLFSEPERENGRAAWLLGACFISEGAIPFAAADPLRVIPSMMFGGAITGAICMATGTASPAPHGGFFVLFAIGNPAWFVIAILIGTVASALAVIGAKQFTKPTVTAEPSPALATA